MEASGRPRTPVQALISTKSYPGLYISTVPRWRNGMRSRRMWRPVNWEFKPMLPLSCSAMSCLIAPHPSFHICKIGPTAIISQSCVKTKELNIFTFPAHGRFSVIKGGPQMGKKESHILKGTNELKSLGVLKRMSKLCNQETYYYFITTLDKRF